jgi:hypothetical protein
LYRIGQLNIIDLSSEPVREVLKSNTTKEEYDNIMLAVKFEEVDIIESANRLIQAMKSKENFSSRNIRNILNKHDYKQDHDFIAEYDTGIIEKPNQTFVRNLSINYFTISCYLLTQYLYTALCALSYRQTVIIVVDLLLP